MSTVREIMTRDPERVDADAMVQEAARVMRDLNVGSVPVVSSGKVHGIVTDRDITLRVIAEDRNPGTVRVGDIASPGPVTVTPDTSVESAARLMAAQQIRRLPVVENGQLVGMLSLGDISVEGSTAAAGKALTEISTPSEPER